MGRNHLSVCQILKKLRIILACRDITYPVAALEFFNAIGSNKRKSFTNNYIRVIAKAEAGLGGGCLLRAKPRRSRLIAEKAEGGGRVYETKWPEEFERDTRS